MAGQAQKSKLHAVPDGEVVWDAWMRKHEDEILKLEARRDKVFSDWSSIAAIDAQFSWLFGRGDSVLTSLAVLKWHGAEALPIIGRVIDELAVKRFESLITPCVRLMKSIQTDAAVDRLLSLLAHADARDALMRHAVRWPIYMLRRLLALRPNRNHPAAGIVLHLLHDHPDWIEPLEQACDEVERQTLARLRQPTEAVEEAGVDELPEVLRRPPWRDRTALPTIPVLKLAPQALPVRFHWNRWSVKLGPPDPKGHWYTEGRPTLLDFRFDKLAAQAPAGAQDWDAARKALWLLGLAPESIERAILDQAVSPEWFQTPPDSGYDTHLYLWQLPAPLAASVLEHIPASRFSYISPYEHYLPRLVHWLGERMLPSFRRWLPKVSREYLPMFRCIEWDALVPDMAQLYCRNRWLRSEALLWLRDYAETVAHSLIPVALGSAGSARDIARQTLRDLAALGHADALNAVAASWGPEASEALAAMLAVSGSDALPDTLPTIPKKLFLPSLPRLLLRGSTRAVPQSAVPDVLMTLALCKADADYPGLEQIQSAVTDESLARFGRQLFEWWMDNDAPSKERWMFTAQGLIGNDETARILASAIRQWRAKLIRVRAYDGMEMLVRIGSDAALMHLHSLSAQTRYGDLRTRAEAMISQIAQARGLTLEELSDRCVPDLGLDSQGRLELDFGARRFSVHFNEMLQPFVRDAKGTRLKDLPKPNSQDDATAAAAAVQQYKDLKKQVRSLAGLQLKRLEAAMCSERRWTRDEFTQLLLPHPLLRHLVQRLLWGVFDANDAPVSTFRVAEDLSLADVQDQAFSLPADARIGIVHPVRQPEQVIHDFGRVLADYEILQPFDQLGRAVYRLDPALGSDNELPEWVGRKITVGSLLGLEQRGWNRSVGDGGMIDALIKPLADGRTMTLYISSDEGWFVGGPAESSQVHEIFKIVLDHGRSRADAPRARLDQLGEVQFSEIQRDLHLMAWFVE